MSQILKFDELEPRKIQILQRYFSELCLHLQEANRVFKKDAFAFYVIGNSAINGKKIENDNLLKRAAHIAGFRVTAETIREIPDNKRYLPIAVNSENSLSKRMRTEHVISFLRSK